MREGVLFPAYARLTLGQKTRGNSSQACVLQAPTVSISLRDLTSHAVSFLHHRVAISFSKPARDLLPH